jgi:hypothetical protein
MVNFNLEFNKSFYFTWKFILLGSFILCVLIKKKTRRALDTGMNKPRMKLLMPLKHDDG